MNIMFAERFVQWVLCIIKERKKYGIDRRWREFSEVIGLAQALMLEGIEDMQPEEIGLNVTFENTEAMREYVFNLANQMAAQREVSREAAGLVIDTVNSGSYKYAYALLMLGANEQERKMQEAQQQQFQQEMALKDKDLEIAQTLQAAAAQGRNSNIQTQGQVDAAIDQQVNDGKYRTQSALVQQRHDNKMQSDQQKSELKKDENSPQPVQI
jgi:hypothetical protein